MPIHGITRANKGGLMMIIRKANPYETNQLLNWSVSFTEELSMGYMKPNLNMTYDMVTKVLANGGYYLVAQNDREIFAWILLGFDQNYYKNEPVGFLYELYVFPQYRNHGVGKILIKHALFHLRNAGMKKVQLNVFAGNPAKRLYENLGFKEVTALMEKPL